MGYICPRVSVFYLLLAEKVLGIFLAVSLAVVIAITYVVIKAYIWSKYDYWHFNGDSIVRVKQANLTISVSEIECIRFGLPPLSGSREGLIKLLDGSHHFSFVSIAGLLTVEIKF
ncbi:hypothetical protein [Pleionea sp. CnH1-48]|uniref:hypothetical protein n=1 Tax=Pleionea sp. CnH1-48 TaxID=2954494 RepID=UPI002096BBA7|nr:hypothetical protein [Pleionea sp. CnH1-48]MCO7224356.1 hypothetical protein [Pleionea sp. CnH1-48]